MYASGSEKVLSTFGSETGAGTRGLRYICGWIMTAIEQSDLVTTQSRTDASPIVQKASRPMRPGGAWYTRPRSCWLRSVSTYHERTSGWPTWLTHPRSPVTIASECATLATDDGSGDGNDVGTAFSTMMPSPLGTPFRPRQSESRLVFLYNIRTEAS